MKKNRMVAVIIAAALVTGSTVSIAAASLARDRHESNSGNGVNSDYLVGVSNGHSWGALQSILNPQALETSPIAPIVAPWTIFDTSTATMEQDDTSTATMEQDDSATAIMEQDDSAIDAEDSAINADDSSLGLGIPSLSLPTTTPTTPSSSPSTIVNPMSTLHGDSQDQTDQSANNTDD